MRPKEIDGQKLVVTILDDASDPTAATVAARKLTSEYKVDVLVGPSITPTSLAAVQVAGDAETPITTAQARGVAGDPSFEPLPCNLDVGLTMFRRLIARQLEREASTRGSFQPAPANVRTGRLNMSS